MPFKASRSLARLLCGSGADARAKLLAHSASSRISSLLLQWRPRRKHEQRRTGPQPLQVAPDLEEIGQLFDQKMAPHMEQWSSQLLPIIEPIVAAKVNAALAECSAQLADRFERQAALIETLTNRVFQLEALHNNHDKAARVNSLIIKGVPEEGNHSGHGVHTTVARFFPSSSTQNGPAILEARRLGKPREQPGALPCPILVKFASSADKHSALAHSRTMRAKRIYLDDDLTLHQQRVRFSKRDRFLFLKGQGGKLFWRGDHLYYYHNNIRKVELPGAPRGATSAPSPADTDHPAPAHTQAAAPAAAAPAPARTRATAPAMAAPAPAPERAATPASAPADHALPDASPDVAARPSEGSPPTDAEVAQA